MRENNSRIYGVPENAASGPRRGDVFLRRLSLVGALDTGLPCIAKDPGQNKTQLVSTPKRVSLFLIPDNMADLMGVLPN